jgi:hypothetical protein
MFLAPVRRRKTMDGNVFHVPRPREGERLGEGATIKKPWRR